MWTKLRVVKKERWLLLAAWLEQRNMLCLLPSFSPKQIKKMLNGAPPGNLELANPIGSHLTFFQTVSNNPRRSVSTAYG